MTSNYKARAGKATGIEESLNDDRVIVMSVMLEPRTSDPRLRQAQRAVLARLADVRRRLRAHLLAEGLFWTSTALVVAAGATLVLDRLVRFNLPTRWALLAIAVAAVLAVFVQRLVRPLLLRLDTLDLAELLDRRSPGVGHQIASVLQLPELLQEDHHASASMVHAAVQECAEALSAVNLTSMLDAARRRRLLAACAAWLLATIGFCVIWPDVAGLWARRWLAGSTVRWPQATYLNLDGLGDDDALLVPRGEMSLLQINARPTFVADDNRWRLSGRGETLWVETADAPASVAPPQVSVSYVLADGSRRRGNAAQFDETNFRYELPPLAEPIELSITGGDDWLGPIRVEPVDRPAVATLEIISRRPGSKETQRQQVGEGSEQLLFLPQTELELRLTANQPLRSAQALDRAAPAPGWRRVDDRCYTLTWTMQDSLALEFRLVGERGGLTSKPTFLAIGLLKDREPRVTVRAAGVGRRITLVARIPLSLRVTDDFGVASLALDFERTEVRDDKPHVETKRQDLENGPQADAAAPARTDVELAYDLELRPLGFAPGNMLKLRGTATDRCALGTQSGNSRWITFQIVSADELFYEILMRQREQRAKFGSLRPNRPRRRPRPSRRWPIRKRRSDWPERSKLSTARYGKWPINSMPRSKK